ncbi:MAG: hypothetical protein EOM92_21185 [Gammaproteobacteria bacterium]|nr:hypothetical protein [Gammaproteobacteria bacterium]
MAPDVVSFIEGELRKRGVEPSVCRAVSAAARAEFGGSSTYIRSIDREARDAKAAELVKLGASAKLVAREVGVHPATIRRKRSGWL